MAREGCHMELRPLLEEDRLGKSLEGLGARGRGVWLRKGGLSVGGAGNQAARDSEIMRTVRLGSLSGQREM